MEQENSQDKNETKNDCKNESKPETEMKQLESIQIQYHVKTKDELNDIKREAISFEGEFESFLIGLLMRHGVEFVVLKPHKIKRVGKHSLHAIFLTIDEIEVNSKTYSFQQFINHKIIESEKQIESERLGKHRKKYYKRNLISSTINFLTEIISSIGYTIQWRKTRKTRFVMKMNRVTSISGYNLMKYTTKDISSIGQEINNIFLGLFSTDNELKRNEPLMFSYDMIEHIDSIFPKGINLEKKIDKFLVYQLQLVENLENETKRNEITKLIEKESLRNLIQMDQMKERKPFHRINKRNEMKKITETNQFNQINKINEITEINEIKEMEIEEEHQEMKQSDESEITFDEKEKDEIIVEIKQQDNDQIEAYRLIQNEFGFFYTPITYDGYFNDDDSI